MGFTFGNTSAGKLATCNKDLQLIANTAIALSPIDFGIAEGHRSIERQNQLFKEGKSKVDGIKVKGKHNQLPSEAFDVYAYVNGTAIWDEKHLCFIGGILIAVSELLYAQGKIKTKLRWGGNWDGDGEIIYDQTFIDLPHFESK